MMRSHEQIEQWRLIQKTYLEDAETMELDKDTDLKRSQVQQEMVQLLTSFLEGSIALYEFNAVFQHKTHNVWSVFGLRGMSGGLFLNKLVKHIPNEDILANQLRAVLREPKDVIHSQPGNAWNGRECMQGFTQFLEGLIASRQVSRSQLQPARVPFFLSAWWHLQASEKWPVFYFHARRALIPEEDSLRRLRDPVEDYFEFRSRYMSLVRELNISLWDLEHICAWYVKRNAREHSFVKQNDPCPSNASIWPSSTRGQELSVTFQPSLKDEDTLPVQDKGVTAQKEKSRSSLRTHLLWILAKIGLKVGYQAWIALNDHNTLWNSEKLGSLSVESLPSLGDPAIQDMMSSVDVVWLQKNNVVAVYAIEQAVKNIPNDLLRLCDLSVLLPKRDIHLCLVTPHQYFEKVQLELSRPTFHKSEKLRDLALISSDMLVQHQEHILRWASSPSIIHDLVSHLNGGMEQS